MEVKNYSVFGVAASKGELELILALLAITEDEEIQKSMIGTNNFKYLGKTPSVVGILKIWMLSDESMKEQMLRVFSRTSHYIFNILKKESTINELCSTTLNICEFYIQKTSLLQSYYVEKAAKAHSPLMLVCKNPTLFINGLPDEVLSIILQLMYKIDIDVATSNLELQVFKALTSISHDAIAKMEEKHKAEIATPIKSKLATILLKNLKKNTQHSNEQSISI